MRKIKIGVYVNMYDRIINKNGVEVYAVQELPDGSLEVGFNSCNKTKVCSKAEFTNGTVTDFITVPHGESFGEYHLGEQRFQQNGHLCEVIGGSRSGLRIIDRVTNKICKCTYTNFYNGVAFTQSNSYSITPDFAQQRFSFKMLPSFTFNGITVLKYGNKARGYIPCIKIETDKYRVWNIKRRKEEVLTLKELGNKLNIFREYGAGTSYGCNFFTGMRLNILPFNIGATIVCTDYSDCSVDAQVKLDNTETVVRVDLFNPYLYLRGMLVGGSLAVTSDGSEYGESKAGILYYFDDKKKPLLLRNLKMHNGGYFIDASYKVKGTDKRIRTKSVRLIDIDVFIHDEGIRMA